MTAIAARIALALAVVAAGAAVAAPAAGAAENEDRIVIAGGTEVAAGEIAGDVIAVAGDVLVVGEVRGDLIAVAGDVRVTGAVEGDVIAVAGRVTLGSGARVGGDLIYGDEEPAIAPDGEVAGEVREEGLFGLTDAPWAAIGALALWLAVGLSLLVLGTALVGGLPRAAEAVNEEARSSVLLAIAIGLAVAIGLPLAAVLAMVSVVGIPLGIGTLLALLPLLALGYVASAFVLGRVVVSEGAHPLLAFLAGFGILRVAALVPVLGTLVWISAAVFGLGSMALAAGRRAGPG